MNLFRLFACCAALAAAPLASAQQLATFRLSDLDLRDPHLWVNFLGCRDVTDTPLVGFSFNNELQLDIQTDRDDPPDGYLESSTLIDFLPLDQSAATNLIDVSSARCTAPMDGTSCDQLVPFGVAGNATLATTGQCLGLLPVTVRPYAPPVTASTGPCFASPAATVTVQLAGTSITLRDARIAATFVSDPATGLVNGLLRGFLSEADANATIIPASTPLIGGQPLSVLLAGGNGNCAAFSDKDTQDGLPGGTPGWWFYLNFPAMRVASDPFADGFIDGFE